MQAVGKGPQIDESCLTTWEDNMGVLTLANLDPGQSTPRSKFYDSKVHWFCSHLTSMQVRKVDAKEQFSKRCVPFGLSTPSVAPSACLM